MSSKSWQPRISRFNKRAVILYSVVLSLAWVVALLRGMFPFFENSLLVDLGVVVVLGLPLAGILIAMLCSLGHNHPRELRKPFSWRLVLAGLLALGGTVLLILGYPPKLGARLGGKLEIGTQPVRDLQQSPAVAQIAASGNYGALPEEAWPESVKNWKVHVRGIEVIPHTASPPDIRIIIGHRGARVDYVSVQHEPPQDTEEEIFTQWADGVWLSRRLGGD